MISDKLALAVSGLIQVSNMALISAMAGYFLYTDLIFAQVTFGHLGDPWSGLMSPASRSMMKRWEGNRAGGSVSRRW